MFDFDMSDVLEEHMKPAYKIDYPEAEWDPDTGKKVQGEPVQTEFDGADFPLSSEDLQFDEAGTYTSEDRKLYTTELLAKGQEVKVKGKLYTVHRERDYADIAAGLRIYIIRRAGESG